MHAHLLHMTIYATSTRLPSFCTFSRTHVLISALFMDLPPVLWAWIRAPATHFLGAPLYGTRLAVHACNIIHRLML